jgi:hypothetical protein
VIEIWRLPPSFTSWLTGLHTEEEDVSDNEYLAQSIASDRLKEARARARTERVLAQVQLTRAAGGPGRAAWWARLYGLAASSLISRWRNWHPA